MGVPRVLGALGVLLAAGVAVVGYRMGDERGLVVMGAGALLAWFLAYLTAWSVPTIHDVMDRAREPGLGVPRDLRAYDPNIVHEQRLWGSLDTPSGPRPHPDDPGRSHPSVTGGR